MPSLPEFKQAQTYEGHTGSISSVRFSKGFDAGRLILSSSADRTVKIWHTSSGTLLRDWAGHEQGVADVAWSDQSDFAVSASDDGSVRVWDVEADTCLAALRGHDSQVMSVDFSPRGNLIASGGTDDRVVLWDARSGRQLRSIPAHSGPVTGVSFSPDGQLLATSAFDGLIRFWDVATGHCLHTLIDDSAPCVGAVRFTANGRFVLSSTLDSSVRLWDYAGNKAVRCMSGHENTRFTCLPALCCSSENKRAHRIVSATEAGPGVQVWELQSAAPLQTVAGFGGVPLTIDAHLSQDAFVTGEIGARPPLRLFVSGDTSWLREEAADDKEALGIGAASPAGAE